MVLSMRNADNDLLTAAQLTLWHRAWPLAGLATAMIVNVAWIGLLAYSLVKLL